MKRISILGSTGSIGSNTLRIVAQFPERFEVIGLSAGHNVERLERQIRRFRPLMVSVSTKNGAEKLKRRCADIDIEILHGVEGLIKVASIPEVDTVVSAIVGAAGLIPTIAAIRTGKDIALANKETLVMAGDIVRREVHEKKVKMIPIDSEHSAIFQSVLGHRKEDIRRIILTASGGPLFDLSLNEKRKVRPAEALQHPNWRMGDKISIDSATLMNKGLEVIEARWLFDIPIDNIEVLIHRQSIVHSMVEYIDGSIIAQMGVPDMRIPISYALSYPERLPGKLPILDLARVKGLTFERPNLKKFPCLLYAYEATRVGGTMTAVLNAANEVAVRSFLDERIGFLDIPRIIKGTMDRHSSSDTKSLEDILIADHWAREESERQIKRLRG